MKQKSFGTRLLSLLLTTAMLLGLVVLPNTPEAAAASSSSLLELDSQEPDNFATAQNPYGYDRGVAFSLSTGHELLYLGGEDSDKHYNVLNASSIDSVKSFAQGPNSGSTDYAMPEGTWNWVQAVAFNTSKDDGRDNHVFFVGVKESDQCAYAWVLNYKNQANAIVGPVKLGEMTWIGNSYPMWASTSLIEVAAGDFNGDGVDTLLAYVPLNLNDNYSVGCSLFELNYSSNSQTLTLGSSGNHLLMDQYITDQNNKKHKDQDDTGGDARDKLATSIQVGDFNGDNIDDLAVLSYTHWHSRAEFGYYKPVLKISYGIAPERDTSGEVTKESPIRSVVDMKVDNAYTLVEALTVNSDMIWQYSGTAFPMGACLAVGDFNGDSLDDLYITGVMAMDDLVASYKDIPDVGVVDMGDGVYSAWYLKPVYGNVSGVMTAGGVTGVYANNWFNAGFFSSDKVYGKVMSAGVAINGGAAPEMLFVSGSLYDVSTGTPIKVSQDSYFNSSDDGATKGGESAVITNTYMNSVAVGNFDNNDAGREQVVYVIGLKQKNQDDYWFKSGIVCGQNFQDSTYADGSDCYGAAKDYYWGRSGYIHVDKGDNIDEGLLCSLIPVDYDTDGVVAKYINASYAYADPEVLAVLQAAPYFGDIATAGLNGTGYTVGTTYSFADETSNGGGGSIGITGGGGFPFVFNVSSTLSFTANGTTDFTQSLNKTYQETFAAGGEDTVVVQRIPVHIFQYDVQDEDGNWSGSTQLEMCVPQEPVRELLTVEDYNAFAESYNARFEEAGVGDYQALVPIDLAANWMAGNEGNPYAYNQTGWSNAAINAEQISANSYSLGKTGGLTTVSWSEENATTEGFTVNVGGSFDFSIQFGSNSAGAGFALNGYYEHGFGEHTTNGTVVGATCTVQDLNGTELKAAGMTQEVLDMYGFTWTFGQWQRHLYGESNVYTPFVGYSLSNISSPAPSVHDLQAAAVSDTEIRLIWSKPTQYAGGPEVTGYYVYQANADGTYTKISDHLSANADYYVVTGLNQLTEYTFVVTSTRLASGTTLEGAWSNEATAMTRMESYTVTFEAENPTAATVEVYTTGHVPIESGDEVRSHSALTVHATATKNCKVYGIQIDRGNGTPVQFVEANDAQTEASCVIAVVGDTKITVLTDKTVDSSMISYQGIYEENGVQIGTVSCEVDGIELAPNGAVVSMPATFTAEPAEGYLLYQWKVTADGKENTIPASGQNPYTLELRADTYYVEAVFVSESTVTVDIQVTESPEGGYVRLTDKDGEEIPVNGVGVATVPYGVQVTATAVCSAGYRFREWTGIAAEQTENPCVFVAGADCVIGAVFYAPIKYQMNYGVTSGNTTGAVTIEPLLVGSGGYVAAGAELTAHIKAADGYRISEVVVTVGTTTETYDFNDDRYTEVEQPFTVSGNTTIEATFVPVEEYTVHFYSSSGKWLEIMINGKTVELNGANADNHYTDSFKQTCYYGDDIVVNAIPDDGFWVLDNNGTLDWDYVGNGTYRITYPNLCDDITVGLNFAQNSGGVIPTNDEEYGYRITNVIRYPDYTQPETEVVNGGSLTFTVEPVGDKIIQNVGLWDPYDAFKNERITDNGDGTWTVELPKVDGSPDLEVTFVPQYLVKIPEPENGTITVTHNGRLVKNNDKFYAGEELQITASAAPGYEVERLTVNETPVIDGKYTMENKAAYVDATFVRAVYALPQSGDGYVVSEFSWTTEESVAEGYVPHGVNLTFRVTPTEGKCIRNITLNAGTATAQEDGSWIVTVNQVSCDIQMQVQVGSNFILSLEEPVNGTVTASRRTTELADGATIYEGERITFEAQADSKYKVGKWVIEQNGETTEISPEEDSEEASLSVEVTGDMTVTAVFEKLPTNTVTVNQTGKGLSVIVSDGIFVPNGGEVVSGADVVIIALPGTGWAMKDISGWTEVAENRYARTLTNIQEDVVVDVEFVQVACVVTVEQPAAGGSIVLLDVSGQKLTPDEDGVILVAPGSKITAYVNLEANYSFGGWTGAAKGKSGTRITLTVTDDITIGVKLNNVCVCKNYTDLNESDWYHDACVYAINNGIMQGTSANTFSPSTQLSRAMLVQILYNQEGKPAVTADNVFTDVPDNSWYTAAVTWAASNGIVTGVGNGRFAPDDLITREQMAVMLYRYAEFKQVQTTARTDLAGYTDAAKVSAWAKDAISWAVAEGIMNGTSKTTLSPRNNTTRAEAATMMMRFIENILK